MPKPNRSSRAQRRRILLGSDDGPDGIDFEHRRIGNNRYSSVPRRRSDKQIFNGLSQLQQEAYNLIERGRHYAEFSATQTPRMRFTDARGGYQHGLTKKQIRIRDAYLQWRKHTLGSIPHCAFAVTAYLENQTLRQIGDVLRVHHSCIPRYIETGLTEYCILKGWTEQPYKRHRFFGLMNFPQSALKFIMDYVNGVGLPVRDFKTDVDEARQ
jgi:hypothetical protein